MRCNTHVLFLLNLLLINVVIVYVIGMEILGELAWCIDNAELLAQLPDEVYERILFCTLVPDVEVGLLTSYCKYLYLLSYGTSFCICRCSIVALRHCILCQV